MELILTRRWLSLKSTVGELTIDGAPECVTLEDRYRPPPEPKILKETAIPNGRYEVVIDHSARFGRDMPHVLAVPGFDGIRIHPGNTAADTEGCILVGTTRDQDEILNSRVAFDALYAKLSAALARGEQVFLTVRLASVGEQAVC